MKEELQRQQAEYQKQQAKIQEEMFRQARENVRYYYSSLPQNLPQNYSNPLGGFNN